MAENRPDEGKRAVGQPATLTPEQRLIRRMWTTLGNIFEHSLDQPRPTIEGMGHLPDVELAALRSALPGPDEEAERLVREEVAEHVSEIVFDGTASAERDCLLCQRGIEFGLWQRFGVDDPFSPAGDDA